ncbi:ArnT family glycosyltransferase [Stenomitos frigidus]|uniref:4-amino-4-deoxy-L-arabinose transferase n=1 Tax=Stenomitos frigidus ULC18 TaxID=2107698 RepID=A0A2T1E6D3_9CYAN|nr:glycosyltransferase family 39 protein [Stenomitos frigidus]PSB28288.1 4-amino-4-deoxy-L-arabinose transferase [Stenomitos frigidus ULC18]
MLLSVLPFLIAFILLRLVFWFTTFPNPDEAYYWLWGQHPAFSYYDHPPLEAWIQGLFTAVLGRSTFTLRLPNLLSNAAFFYTYYQIIRYLYGENARQSFWLVVLLILASPLYFLFLALAWHDHLLITLSLVSAYLLIRFLDSYVENGKGESWRLYSAAGAIALAMLSKYNAIFVVLGFAATLVADKRLRSLWRDRRLYLASVIALTALIPIVLWNLSNRFQSFHYYIDRSVGTGSFNLKFSPFFNFVLFSILLVSPMLCFGFFHGLKRSIRQHQIHSVYPTVAFWVFMISSIILTGISLTSAALYYWNITAYLLLFPLLPAFFSQKLADRGLGSQESGVRSQESEKLNAQSPAIKPQAQIQTSKHFSVAAQSATQSFLHCLSQKPLFLATQFYGLLFATLLVVHYSVFPISALFDKETDPDSRMLFGWSQVADVVKTQSEAAGNDRFLATTDYRSASALAYQLNDKSVTAISDRVDQFDFWYTSDAAFKGRNALILSDDWHPVQSELLAQFDRTSAPITVPIIRFGIWIKNYYLVKGYGFRGGRVS